MELSSKLKGLKFMRRKEDAKERAAVEASRHTSTPTIVPTRPLPSLHPSTSTLSLDKDEGIRATTASKGHPHPLDSITPTTGTKDQVLIRGTKSTLQIQYEPSLTSLLQPSIRTTRLAHKDYKAPTVVTSETAKEGGEGDEMDVDEGALKKEADKKASIKKQMHAAHDKAFRPPMKRDKKGESHGSAGKSSSSRKKQ